MICLCAWALFHSASFIIHQPQSAHRNVTMATDQLTQIIILNLRYILGRSHYAFSKSNFNCLHSFITCDLSHTKFLSSFSMTTTIYMRKFIIFICLGPWGCPRPTTTMTFEIWIVFWVRYMPISRLVWRVDARAVLGFVNCWYPNKTSVYVFIWYVRIYATAVVKKST